MAKPASVETLDPGIALRSGSFDSTTLLLLRAMRRLFFPMLWIGIASAMVSGREEFVSGTTSISDFYGQFENPGDIGRSLLSPLAPLILAFGVRIAVSFLALALAYPLTLWSDRGDYPTSRGSGSRRRLWIDRLLLTRAYSSLRWTWAVQEVAVVRAGKRGPTLALAERILVWSSPFLFIIMVIVIAATGQAT